MKTRTFLFTVLTASLLAASAAPAVSCTLSDLCALQMEYAQLVNDFQNGNATLSDLVRFQQRVNACQRAYVSSPMSTSDLVALQVEYAQLVDDFRNGDATLADLVRFQRALAQFREAFVEGSNDSPSSADATEACSMYNLIELQTEYAQLVEAMRRGEASLGDLVLFQQSVAAFLACYAPSETRTASSAVAGIGTAAVESASWGQIKSSYRD